MPEVRVSGHGAAAAILGIAGVPAGDDHLEPPFLPSRLDGLRLRRTGGRRRRADRECTTHHAGLDQQIAS